MSNLDKINNIEMTSILEKLGIKYGKLTNGTISLFENGKKTDGWKLKVANNFVSNFTLQQEDRAIGEPFSFVMKYLKKDEKETFEWFESTFGIKNEFQKFDKNIKNKKDDLILKELDNKDKNQTKHLQKIEERTGISFEILKSDGVKFGIYKGHEALLFPLFMNNKQVGWQKRDLFAKDKAFKSISLKNKGLLGNGEIKEKLTILAGEIDFYTALNLGFEGLRGLPGEKGSNDIFEELKQIGENKEVTAICDNDETGILASEKLKEIFPEIEILFPNPKLGKDLNDLYKHFKGDKEQILANLYETLESTESSLEDIFDSKFEEWTKIATDKGFKSPFEKLNENCSITGLNGLIAVGGGNNVGKTAFVIQTTNFIAKNQNTPILWLSFEHSDREILQRSIAKYSDISLEEALNNGKYEEYIYEGFGELSEEGIAKNLFIKHSSDLVGLNAKKITNWVKEIKKKTKKDKLIIVVDYLQKLPDLTDFKGKDIREKVNNNLTFLRSLINEEKATIFMVVALNRESQKADKSMPTINDFRDSGDIEYSIDLALFLTNNSNKIDEFSSEEERIKAKSEVNLYTLKNRNNSTKNMHFILNFDFKKMIFKENF